MKKCAKCSAECDDSLTFCPKCGSSLNQTNEENEDFESYYKPYKNFEAPKEETEAEVDLSDHTADFDKKDISDNKIIAMICYLFGFLGIITAFIGGKDSPYVSFHVRQALKLLICEALVWLIAAATFYLIITVIAAGVFSVIFFVLRIIAFVQVCKNEAKEPAIIKKLNFLK